MGESSRLKQVDQPQVMRRRSGDHGRRGSRRRRRPPRLPVDRRPGRPYIDPLVRLEEARCEVFSALAPIVGAEPLTDLLADFDAALVDLGGARPVTDDAASAINPEIDVALDAVRLDEIARLAALAASYWRSVELAADRGNTLTVVTHCRQVASVTRDAFAIVKTLGSTEVEP